MILTNFIFVILHLKIHPAVHLNLQKLNVIVVKKKSLLKVYQLSLFLCSNLCKKKDKIAAERAGSTNRAEKNCNKTTLVTIIIMLL